MTSCVLKHNNVHLGNVVIDTFDQQNEILNAKIWYHDNILSNKPLNPHTFFIQTPVLDVIRCKKMNSVDGTLVVNADQLESAFDGLDKYIVNTLKERKILSKYSIKKKCEYKTILSFEEDVNILSLSASHCNFFSAGKSMGKLNEEFVNLLNVGSDVRLIIEIESVSINLTKCSISTNVILRQAEIQRLPPKHITLSAYSFVDDDETSCVISMHENSSSEGVVTYDNDGVNNSECNNIVSNVINETNDNANSKEESDDGLDDVSNDVSNDGSDDESDEESDEGSDDESDAEDSETVRLLETINNISKRHIPTPEPSPEPTPTPTPEPSPKPKKKAPRGRSKKS